MSESTLDLDDIFEIPSRRAPSYTQKVYTLEIKSYIGDVSKQSPRAIIFPLLRKIIQYCELQMIPKDETSSDEFSQETLEEYITDLHKNGNHIYYLIKVQLSGEADSIYKVKKIMKEFLKITKTNIMNTILDTGYNCQIGWLSNVHPTKIRLDILKNEVKNTIKTKINFELKPTSIYNQGKYIQVLVIRCAQEDANELTNQMYAKYLSEKEVKMYAPTAMFIPMKPTKNIPKPVFNAIVDEHNILIHKMVAINIHKEASEEKTEENIQNINEYKNAEGKKIVLGINIHKEEILTILTLEMNVSILKMKLQQDDCLPAQERFSSQKQGREQERGEDPANQYVVQQNNQETYADIIKKRVGTKITKGKSKNNEIQGGETQTINKYDAKYNQQQSPSDLQHKL